MLLGNCPQIRPLLSLSLHSQLFKLDNGKEALRFLTLRSDGFCFTLKVAIQGTKIILPFDAGLLQRPVSSKSEESLVMAPKMEMEFSQASSQKEELRDLGQQKQPLLTLRSLQSMWNKATQSTSWFSAESMKLLIPLHGLSPWF
jgi:hypothetical protein